MDVLREKLIGDGFSVKEHLDMGLTTADIYASQRIRLFFYPYDMHCYIFNCPDNSPITLQQVVSYHALACTYTDRFKSRRSRWLRFRVPITMSVVISKYGFDDMAIDEVYVNKPRYQMGNVNALMLIDLSKKTLHSLDKPGVVGVLPLRHTNRIAQRIAGILRIENKGA